jgi:transcription elongation factor Elf1
MIRAILNSLRDAEVDFNSNDIAKHGYFEPIPNTGIYLMYSIRFKLDRQDFKRFIGKTIKNLNICKDDPDFLYEALEISYNWYTFYTEHKKLFSSNSSLKSDMRKIYKKRIPNLKDFDRFFETVLNAFSEAFTTYTVVFYRPDAIYQNDKFVDDRKSCYINGRPDNFKAIHQAKAYYVMIYKDQTPVTRVWFLCDKDYNNAVIFNPYGKRLINLPLIFGDKDELINGNHKKLKKALGIFVNEDTILTTTREYNRFTYELFCPTCGQKTISHKLITLYDDKYDQYKIKCDHCSGYVYSDFYGNHIPEKEAVYSEYYKTYLYKDEAVFSDYVQSYIHQIKSQQVWNFEKGCYDYVPLELLTFVDQKWVIKEQIPYLEKNKELVEV